MVGLLYHIHCFGFQIWCPHWMWIEKTYLDPLIWCVLRHLTTHIYRNLEHNHNRLFVVCLAQCRNSNHWKQIWVSLESKCKAFRFCVWNCCLKMAVMLNMLYLVSYTDVCTMVTPVISTTSPVLLLIVDCVSYSMVQTTLCLIQRNLVGVRCLLLFNQYHWSQFSAEPCMLSF